MTSLEILYILADDRNFKRHLFEEAMAKLREYLKPEMYSRRLGWD